MSAGSIGAVSPTTLSITSWRLADGEAAERIAVEADSGERARARLAQVLIVAALHDAEQRLADGRLLEGALAALGPAQRQLHGALDLAPLGRQPHAFVELHGDVGAEQDLHLDGALRRQLDHGAVEMGAEGDALLLDFAQGRKRHHLEAAGIGQDRMRPAHETVQPAERRDPLGRRPQHQVIGVGEHDVGAGRRARRHDARP